MLPKMCLSWKNKDFREVDCRGGKQPLLWLGSGAHESLMCVLLDCICDTIRPRDDKGLCLCHVLDTRHTVFGRIHQSWCASQARTKHGAYRQFASQARLLMAGHRWMKRPRRAWCKYMHTAHASTYDGLMSPRQTTKHAARWYVMQFW